MYDDFSDSFDKSLATQMLIAFILLTMSILFMTLRVIFQVSTEHLSMSKIHFKDMYQIVRTFLETHRLEISP